MFRAREVCVAQGKFVAYYRVSTARQGASGLGLEAQKDAVRTHLNGGSWSLVDEVTEVESDGIVERMVFKLPRGLEAA